MSYQSTPIHANCSLKLPIIPKMADFSQKFYFGHLWAPIVAKRCTWWGIYGFSSLHRVTDCWFDNDKLCQKCLFLLHPLPKKHEIPWRLIFHRDCCLGQLWAFTAEFQSPPWGNYWADSLHHITGCWFDGVEPFKRVLILSWPAPKLPNCTIFQKWWKLHIFTFNVQLKLRISRWCLRWLLNPPEGAPRSVLSWSLWRNLKKLDLLFSIHANVHPPLFLNPMVSPRVL